MLSKVPFRGFRVLKNYEYIIFICSCSDLDDFVSVFKQRHETDSGYYDHRSIRLIGFGSNTYSIVSARKSGI
jgi:hypothetical protein